MAIKQAGKSLASRHSPLADTLYQLEVLNQHEAHVSDHPSFTSSLERVGYPKLSPVKLEILQINIGKQCNQSCAHCHVDAGPDRTETMSKELLSTCLDIIRRAVSYTHLFLASANASSAVAPTNTWLSLRLPTDSEARYHAGI